MCSKLVTSFTLAKKKKKKKANADRIREELKDLADNVTSNSESKKVDEKWNEFELGVRGIMDTNIPHKMSTSP